MKRLQRPDQDRDVERKKAYAAVLAIWPKRPGPCEAWGGAWAVAVGGACWAPAPWAGAYVVAGRVCWAWGAGARDGTLGRAGAERPAER